jgi:hypothetical protein
MGKADEDREMASGNTFGATTLASYGGYWISWAIIYTPGGFGVVQTLETEGGGKKAFLDSFGFYLMVPPPPRLSPMPPMPPALTSTHNDRAGSYSRSSPSSAL